MTKIPLKLKKWPKYQKTKKMTKITPKPKKWPKYLQNSKNDQNTPETQKMTKIPFDESCDINGLKVSGVDKFVTES